MAWGTLKDTRTRAPGVHLKRAGVRLGYRNEGNSYCYPDLPIAKVKANASWEGAWSLASPCTALPGTPTPALHGRFGGGFFAFFAFFSHYTHRAPFCNFWLLDADQACGALGKAGQLPREASTHASTHCHQAQHVLQ